jgi:hypothetical protein
MKTLKFSFFFAVFELVNSQIDGKREFAALAAIKGVLQDHFVLNEPKVDLLYFGPESEVMVGKLS